MAVRSAALLPFVVRADLEAAARLLEERSQAELSFTPHWMDLHPTPERPAVAAVDGSHAVLADTGSVWIVATRAAAVQWPSPPQPETPITISATTPGDAQPMVDEAFGAHGLEPPKVRGAEAFAEAIRSLQEMEAALEALAALPDDGLLLLDGALERLPKLAQSVVEKILAGRHHTPVVGVAKRSRLEIDGAPLVATLYRLGRRQRPDTAWAVPVPEYASAYVAHLHPAAKHAFRVDTTDAEALHDLLPLCRDAVYTGYPYPLAVAHNTVAISQAQARSLRSRLGDAVRHQGAEAWHLLQDFHDILDHNAPR